MAAGPAPGRLEAARLWARIGLLSFGGPAGQIALMHRELVAERSWLSERDFLHATNFCMLLPGPEAQQLATYAGWRLHGVAGGIVAGTLFILPGALTMLALAFLYATLGQLPAAAALLTGLRAAVIAILVQALGRLSGRLSRRPAGVLLALSAFLALFLFHLPFPLVVLAAALIGWAAGRSGHDLFQPAGHGPEADAGERAGPVADAARRAGLLFLMAWGLLVGGLTVALGRGHLLAELAVFFSKMAVLSFGGAYAVLSWVAQDAVGRFGWLAPGEMIDGLGLAETTPGPLILVVQFVGFLAAFREPGGLAPGVAGGLGALVVLLVTFLPCFAWIFLGAPVAERLRVNRAVAGALAAVSAAAVGMIANLALWFALKALFADHRPAGLPGLALELPLLASANGPAIGLTMVALMAVLWGRAGPGLLVAGGAAAGLALGAAGLL